MYDVYVEVSWDNGINGDDIILIGESCSDNLDDIEQTLIGYFGKQIEVLENNYVKTKRGTCYFWLEKAH